MKHPKMFDVLIVYTSGIAKSAANKKYSKYTKPFRSSSRYANYNTAYAHFLETCSNMGLKAAFCTTDDITGAGTCSSYWSFQNKTWHKINKPCYSNQIFDKFSPINTKRKLERKLLFSSTQITPFNNPYLSSLFFDKLKTYQALSDFAIPSVSIKDLSQQGISKAIRKLTVAAKNLSPNDFTQDIILKDRHGAGGNNIYKITKNHHQEIHTLANTKKLISFIIQPFMNFEKGFSYNNHTTATDIRIIYQNEKPIQTYIRMAKTGDFRCNEHQGGTLLYIDIKSIPKKVLKVSNQIIKKLGQNNSLFAVDFIISNEGNVYLIEGNIGPGLDWNPNLKKNRLKSKQLIKKIITEIGIRSETAQKAEYLNIENITQRQINTKLKRMPLLDDIYSHRRQNANLSQTR